MVNNCASCKLQIKRGAPGLLCAGDCENYFHATCANLTKNVFETISSQNLDWFCSVCKPSKRKSIVSSDLLPSPLSLLPNVNSSSSSIPKNTNNNNNMDSIKTFMASIQTDINEFRKQQTEMLASMEIISEAYEVIKSKLVSMETKCNRLDDIEKENIDLKKTIENQASRITALEQAPLMNCIEISGIPKSIKLKPIEIFDVVSEKIEFVVNHDDIEYCQKSNNYKSNNIIVCFKNQLVKDTYISKKRNKKLKSSIFETADINDNGQQPRNIFINEALCSTVKKILYETKAFAKANDYQFVWVRDGIVFLRKRENERYFKIKSYADLSNIINTETNTTA